MKAMLKRLGTKKIILIAIGALVVIGGGYSIFHKKGSSYTFVTVKRGTISEEVDVTGNTTAAHSVSLTFENAGTVAAVNYDIGAHVSPGTVVASLDTRDLQAQLAQAQAGVDAAVAKLNSLKAGAQPADIQASQAALSQAQQVLANYYTSANNTLADAYTKANDAVRNQIAAFFTNPETNNPSLTFTVSNSQVANNLIAARIASSGELNKWQTEIQGLNGVTDQTTLDNALQSGIAHLVVVKTLLNNAWNAVLAESGLDTTTVNTYKADVTTGAGEANTANGNVNTLIQNIASQKIAVQQAQAQLALKQAGSTANDIAAQQAAVAQAQANAQSIQVKIAKSSLVSPISGVITQQDAKIGQIAAPGTPLVTIISDSNLEVDANVPETDIGKVSLGNLVTMTLDAFPNESFTGKVFSIDPGPTTIQGVVNYLIKVSFDKNDPRIKSGLTANLTIDTQTKNDALILPQFAILQNDQGTFVETIEKGAVAQHPVTLGIHDQEGNVEVVSGVTEGEQVLNIGLKQGS